MVFASPNFSAAYNQPFLQVRSTSNLLFQETGNDYMLTVSGESEYSAGDLTAKPLKDRVNIGRDIDVEINSQLVINKIDWMATNHASSGRHFWYNTLAHGNHEASLKTIIDHVWLNYGPEGTNEAWVASSTEIYSYILTRDNIVLNSEAGNNEDPSPLVNEIFMPSILRLENWARTYSEAEPKAQVQPLILNLSGRGLQQLKSE